MKKIGMTSSDVIDPLKGYNVTISVGVPERN